MSPPLGSHQARQPDCKTAKCSSSCYILENIFLHKRKILIHKRFIVALSELLNSNL